MSADSPVHVWRVHYTRSSALDSGNIAKLYESMGSAVTTALVEGLGNTHDLALTRKEPLVDFIAGIAGTVLCDVDIAMRYMEKRSDGGVLKSAVTGL